jgi:transcriptional regulator with XRE-family HTH domain
MYGFTIAGRRKQAGIEQRDLAAELGCFPQTLSNVETGCWPDVSEASYQQALEAIKRLAARKQELSKKAAR